MTLIMNEDQFTMKAHNTIAGKSYNASDVMVKCQLKFPRHLYGRERELQVLRKIYDGLPSNRLKLEDMKTMATHVEDREFNVASSDQQFIGSRVVFLSGYSGIGKSALVREFIKQIQSKYGPSHASQILHASGFETSPILHVSGKYTNQSTASAPFSAIIEVFEKLALDISRENTTVIGDYDLRSKVLNKIKGSDLIAPGKVGNRILRATFPQIVYLLFEDTDAQSEDELNSSTAQFSMNAIKESTCELLSVICGCLERPLAIFLDDLQWADEASIDMLSLLLTSTKLGNVMFVCAYRSNEVDSEHSFAKLIEKVKGVRCSDDTSTPNTVKTIELSSLLPDAITEFIADSVRREEVEVVAELAEAVYTKTLGNIFFVKQALEELVRRNILFYDYVVRFQWRWNASKIELQNYMSDDVVETVKGKIKELPVDIQVMLMLMAHIPNSINISILTALMSDGEFAFDEDILYRLLKQACDKGMVQYSKANNGYSFAHDRIRQASLEIAGEQDKDELLVHISQVMLTFANQGRGTEWCLFVAVDLLDSLPPDKIKQAELARLNLRVSKIARSKGSVERENEFLHKGLKSLEASGKMWEEYSLTLELCNAIIGSDHSLGSYDTANKTIEEVLNHATAIGDKIQAYSYQILCKCDQSFDYKTGASDCVSVLNMCGFNIPINISRAYMLKEEMKLKTALRYRSYSCLTKLPLKEDPIFALFVQGQKYSSYSSNDSLTKILSWKAIRCAMKRGMSRDLPLVVVTFAALLSKQGDVRAAQELGHVTIDLADKIQDNSTGSCEFARQIVYSAIVTQLQSFRSTVEPLHKCHVALKLCGANAEWTLGAMLGYVENYFAAGLELNSLLETKLLVLEQLCKDLERTGLLTSFQIFRQFTLNLRNITDKPAEFQGDAFHEGDALKEMSSNAHKMTVRDSSSMRLQLAFVFWNENTMEQMLRRLGDYPLQDLFIARLHNRLCFTGLAAFGIWKRKGCESFLKLGQDCLNYYRELTKNGSVNAKPVYMFMLAMKSPSSDTFEKAIHACAKAGMIHLQAMANERYAVFLYGEKNEARANDYITSSFWLYQDWGANGKANQLTQQYSLLKNATRNNAKSFTSGIPTAKDHLVSAYPLDSSFKISPFRSKGKLLGKK